MDFIDEIFKGVRMSLHTTVLVLWAVCTLIDTPLRWIIQACDYIGKKLED